MTPEVINTNFEDFLTYITGLVAAEKADISNAIFTKHLGVSDVTRSHTVITGVKNGSLVPIIDSEPNYESFPFIDANDCKDETCDVSLEYSSKKWELAQIGCLYPFCMKKFDDEFMTFYNQFKILNPAITDLNSIFMSFIVKNIKDNLLASQWRVTYFADKASTSKLFNGFDGFYTQAEAGNGIKIDIPKNAATTLADQRLTGEEVYNTLAQMDDEASTTDWYDEATAQYRLTEFMARPFMNWLNALGDKIPVCCDIYDADAIQQARRFNLNNMRFRGKPIIVHRELDRVIAKTSELNGGSSTTPRVNPNRALLTAKTNLLIGTSQTKDLNYFKAFYVEKEETIYIRANSYIGSSIPTDEYVIAI
jgi:hypothetical protein